MKEDGALPPAAMHMPLHAEILEVNVKETIQNHRKHKAGISMEVYNDLNTVLKGLDE